MSDIEYWVGTREAIEGRAEAQGLTADRLEVVTEISMAADEVAQWIGIDPLPTGSRFFTLHAPIEGNGRAEWTQYRGVGFAPERDLVAARVTRHA